MIFLTLIMDKRSRTLIDADKCGVVYNYNNFRYL